MKRRDEIVSISDRMIMMLVAITCCLLPGTASSDTITLNDGTVIIGEVQGKSADRLEVMTSFGMVELDRTMVASRKKGGPWPEGTAFGPMVADTYGASRIGIGCSVYNATGDFSGAFIDLDLGYGITDWLDAVGFVSRGRLLSKVTAGSQTYD